MKKLFMFLVAVIVVIAMSSCKTVYLRSDGVSHIHRVDTIVTHFGGSFIPNSFTHE